MTEEGYVADGGTNERMEDFYVAVGGQQKRVREAYVAVGGQQERFYVNNKTKVLQETLNVDETRTLKILFGRTESVNLSESLVKNVQSRNKNKVLQETQSVNETRSLTINDLAPSSLSATWNSGDDAVDLSWDPDPDNSQDIYRCPSDSCDPVQDGTKIADVAAGTNSYQDTDPTTGDGSYSYQVKSTRGESNIDSVLIPS